MILTADALKEAQDLGISFELLNEQEQDRYITLLYFGGNGTGKTYFIATAGSRTLIINIGNGLVTINNPLIKAKFYQDGLPIVSTIHEERDPKTNIFKSADAWDKVADAIDFGLKHFSDKFDTIVIDDASMLKAFAAHKGLELSEPSGKSHTLKNARSDGAIAMAIQDYGMEMALIEQFVAGTIALCKSRRKHFILTAHVRETFKKLKDAQGKVIGEEVEKTRPGFTGRTFPDDIARHFDMVWYATVLQASPAPVFRAQTNESKSINAKSRYPGVFDEHELNPNFLDIVRRVHSSLDGKILPKPSELRKTSKKE